MNYQSQIEEAIKLQCKVELEYVGEGKGIVCPHVMYISRPTGKTLVDTYRINGFSEYARPEEIPGWCKPFDISKITHLKILDEKFDIAEDYNPASAIYYNAITMI